MITSPYNFVPLDKRVVTPHWAKIVSHDIPFEDSQSGELDITIKAESPIYVRNGTPRDANPDQKNAFNNTNGTNYFIPGSSIKGMLRSLVEIMSFGRMGNKVNDHKYSVREFSNGNIYNKSFISNSAECGWLYFKDNKYYLIECGRPGRISHEELDKLCDNGTKISTYYKDAKNLKDTSAKSASAKYKQFKFDKENHTFTFVKDDYGRDIYTLDHYGKSKGTIVFTGQPGVRERNPAGSWKGKHLEFIFFKNEVSPYEVADNVIENFLFAVYDHDQNQPKDDWKWRKVQLKEGEHIPVFFRKEKGKILDMGLSLLFKIIYNNSIIESIINHQDQNNSIDLAETIFGFADKNNALKGRVHVGHAFVKNNNITPLPQKTEVLSGPKASYYPNYIQQTLNGNLNGIVNGEYKTLMDIDAVIRGWKRYPVHMGNNVFSNANGVDNQNIRTSFCPLPTGTSFSLKIRYHNLRKEELGAIISALTFHNTSGLFHSIGSGKPLGYGKATITINNLNELRKVELLKSYELYMNYALGNTNNFWFNSMQMKELCSMAKPNTNDKSLKYMGLTDFVKAKGSDSRRNPQPKYALLSYLKINENKVLTQSLITDQQEIETIKNIYDKEKLDFAKVQDISLEESNLITQYKTVINTAINTKKNSLIQELSARKAQIIVDEKRRAKEKEDEAIRERKEKAQKEAIKSGFKIHAKFDTGNKNSLENLNKEVINYAKDLHNCNDNILVNKFSSGKIVQDKDIITITDCIKLIFRAIRSMNDRKSFLVTDEPRNYTYKKIIFLIGNTATNQLFNELDKLNATIPNPWQP